MNMECGGATPLFSGQHLLSVSREPKLAKQSGAEAPRSKPDNAEETHSL